MDSPCLRAMATAAMLVLSGLPPAWADDPPQSRSSTPEPGPLPLTEAEIAAVVKEVRSCWTVPSDQPVEGSDIVHLRVNLAIDGSVTGRPEVTDTERMAEPAFRVLAESAISAVLRCQPYGLPRTKYQLWKVVVMEFDPREQP
jgi:hypothetical protein